MEMTPVSRICHVSDVSLVHSGSNLSDHSSKICTIDMCVEQVPHMQLQGIVPGTKHHLVTYNVMRTAWRKHSLQL